MFSGAEIAFILQSVICEIIESESKRKRAKISYFLELYEMERNVNIRVENTFGTLFYLD